jgi:membrane protease YdiL (CAAX protease family)
MGSKDETANQVIIFLGITTAVTTGIFLWMFAGARDNMAVVFLMMWTPGISALLTSAICRDRISEYGWKPGKLRFLAYGYCLPLLVSIIGYGIVWLGGYAEFSTTEVANYRWAQMLGFALPAPFLVGVMSKMSLGFLVTILFVLGEEIGWSGFLTPKLLKVTSVPATSLIVGAYWAVWHYPAIIGGFYGTGTPLWVALPGFTLVLVAESLVRTVLISKSKSLWVGVVLHASGNVVLMGMFWEMTVHKGYAGYLVSESGVFVGVVYAVVAVFFWTMQGRATVKA